MGFDQQSPHWPTWKLVSGAVEVHIDRVFGFRHQNIVCIVCTSNLQDGTDYSNGVIVENREFAKALSDAHKGDVVVEADVELLVVFNNVIARNRDCEFNDLITVSSEIDRSIHRGEVIVRGRLVGCVRCDRDWKLAVPVRLQLHPKTPGSFQFHILRDDIDDDNVIAIDVCGLPSLDSTNVAGHGRIDAKLLGLLARYRRQQA